MSNILYTCTCGAKFRTFSSHERHLNAFPEKCRKIKVPLTPEQYAETPTEHAQQVALFMWAALPETLAKYPVLEYMFAIPNGGERNPIVASRMVSEGVKRGVPDIFLPVGGFVLNLHEVIFYRGLFIEMKRPTTDDKYGGIPSPEQNKYIEYLHSAGYACFVCNTFDDARRAIITYLDESNSI